MEFQPADYIIGGAGVVFAVLGLFRGFSGTLAFFVASGAAAAAGVFFRPMAVDMFGAEWARIFVNIAVAVVVFGLVRLVVKKIVNGLLAQPTDSIAGVLVGLALWGGLVYAATFVPEICERSVIVREVASHVR